MTTESNSGRWFSGQYGPGTPTGFCRYTSCGPSDSSAITTPVTTAARATTLRRNTTASTADRTSSGQPKNAFSSDGFWLTAFAGPGYPANDSRENSMNARRSVP